MSATNGHTPPALSLNDLREQTEYANARSQLAQAQHEAHIWEALVPPGPMGLGWGDLVNPFQHRHDDFSLWLPLGQGGLYGRQGGRNRPFAWHDVDLDNQRSLARWLATKNDLAIGALKCIRNYTVKKGYKWEARPAQGYEEDGAVLALADQVQRVIDNHADLNRLPQRERSSCWRGVRDGEVFTRHFCQDDGTVLVRFVECEQVRDPGNAGPFAAFGVETEEGDVETPTAYWITYDGRDYDRVEAEYICHYKRNTDECVKRGISDFYSCGDTFDGVYKLLRNMRVGGSILAAMAWIEQFESATREQMSAHQSALKDLNRPEIEHPMSGRRIDYQHFEPGTVVRTQKGKQYLPPPLAGNTTNFTQIVQACLRSVGTRWNMPEYMISGDASNANYSSTLVSGSPFVNAVECEQDDFGLFFLQWRWIAVRHACQSGLISAPFEQVQRLVDIHYTPPEVAVANEAEKAQIDHADMDKGVLSIQTRRSRRGLNDEQEDRNLEEKPLPGRQQGGMGIDDPGGMGDLFGPSEGGMKAYDNIGRKMGNRAHPHRLQASKLSEDFDASKHPRGQPGNPGQFGPGGGSSGPQPSRKDRRRVSHKDRKAARQAAAKAKLAAARQAAQHLSPGQGVAIATDPAKKAHLLRTVAGYAVGGAIGLASTFTLRFAKDFLAAAKTVGKLSIVGKLGAALAGKAEWKSDDTKELVRSLYDVPSFAASQALDYVVPVPGLFPLLYRTPIIKHIFARELTEPSDGPVTRWLEWVDAVSYKPAEWVSGDPGWSKTKERPTKESVVGEDIDLSEHQIEALLALVAILKDARLNRPPVTHESLEESHAEGDVWQGPSGHYFTLVNGHVQPAHAPASQGGEHTAVHKMAAAIHDISRHAITPEATTHSIEQALDALDLHSRSPAELKELAKAISAYPDRNSKAALIDAIERVPLFWFQQRDAGTH